eukprot:GHVL01037592.1.p1 GENE.GHVL01037592.1~~GHVL01037592.1.p1  ORF type:complete len:394 (+),score=78.77 GHVL01037592.1:61-1242(+)
MQACVSSVAFVKDGRAAKRVFKHELTDNERQALNEHIDDREEDFRGKQFFSEINKEEERDDNLEVEYDSEEENVEIMESDVLFAVTNAEHDCSTVELYVYDPESASIFLRHDFMVGGFPICADWVGSNQNKPENANLLAVGTYGRSVIDIWDLDILDPVDPVQEAESHTSTVICLHSHPENEHLIASGGADSICAVTDLVKGEFVKLSHHKKEVQCIQWHPVEQPIILSGSYDRTIAVSDTRQSEKAISGSTVSDVESAIWSRHNPAHILVSDDTGSISAFDVRKLGQSNSGLLWNIEAHESACTGISDCAVPNIFMSCGKDGIAKIWSFIDFYNKPVEVPFLLLEKNLNSGPCYCCRNHVATPGVFIFGTDQPVIWDITDEDPVTNLFKFNG